MHPSAGYMHMRRLLYLVCLLAACAPARAQDYYAGKTINLTVGYGPGGGYDLYARLVQKFMPRYIPGNPAIVMRHMPGAGSLSMANWLYNDASGDGLNIGLTSRIAPLEPIYGNAAARFDSAKFQWIGTPASYEDDAYSIITRKDSAFKTIADAKQPGPPILLGGFANGGSDTDIILLAKSLFSLNAKFIRGYAGGPEVGLAMTRGEVDGRAIGMSSLLTLHGDLVRDGQFNYLVQFGHAKRWKGLPDTPTASELAGNDEDRALIELAELPFRIARPFVAPPKTPQPLVNALRKAFMDTHRDPEYLEEARKLQIEVSPLPGGEMQAILARAAATPRPLVERYRTILSQ